MNAWDIKLIVSEQDGHALAQATLYADREIIRGSGQAFAVGDDGEKDSLSTAVKLAVGRSLLDLVTDLLQSAEVDMHASVFDHLRARVPPD